MVFNLIIVGFVYNTSRATARNKGVGCSSGDSGSLGRGKNPLYNDTELELNWISYADDIQEWIPLTFA